MQSDFLLFTFFCLHLVQLFHSRFVQYSNLPNFCRKESPEDIYHSSFFLFWNYIITIDIIVFNMFKMYSYLLQIPCMYSRILMTTINIILHVSVCGTYFLYLIIEYLWNLFHVTDDHLMWYARAFTCLM